MSALTTGREAARPSWAVYLGFHWLTTWLLVAELARLTAPTEFLWLPESFLWTEGSTLLMALFAGLAGLLVVWPAGVRLASRAGPPLALALAMAINLLWGHSLAWWVVIAAGLVAWGGWVAQLAAGQGRPVVMVGSILVQHAWLAFLYLDTRFFAATNAHLSLFHLWFMHTGGGAVAAGIPPETWRALAMTGTGYVAVTMSFGALLRDRLVPPSRLGIRMGLAALLWMVHLGQFEALANLVPLPDFLNFRLQFGSRWVPQVSRFRKAGFREAWSDLPIVIPAAFYQPGRFTWRASSAFATGSSTFPVTDPVRPHLVMLLVESWRADFLVEGMPALARRAHRGLWLRQHFAQANSTAPAVAALLHGCLPMDYLFQEHRLGEIPFFQFLREAGYELVLISGGPPEGLRDIEQFFRGWLHPVNPASVTNWPGLVDAAFATTLDRLSATSPKALVVYLYSTHFDYRYSATYEKYRPALPEGTEVLSLSPTPETVTGIVNRYKNALAFLDDRLERFFQQLEASGAASRTWVVLVGDHGESLGDAGFFAHATGPHISQFHVPCLIFGPGLTPQTIDRPTQHVDLVPTLANLLGIEATGLVGQDVRVASRSAVLSFDFSADRRLIVRSPARMSLFDLDGRGRLEWVATMRNDFALDEPLVQAYLATDPAPLAELIRQDARWLRELLQPPS